jgi:tetratricopeptide (TPR) repeat protein
MLKVTFKEIKKNIIFVLLLLFLFGGADYVAAQILENTVESVLTEIASLLSESKFEEAIAFFDLIPLPERDSSDLKLLKASVLSSAGKYADARTIVEAVSKAEPANIDALFVLAAIEGVSGRRRQQQTALEQIIKIQPDNVQALIELGNISLQTRLFRAAASYFNKVLIGNPDNAEALLGMSRAFRMNTEWDKAESLLNRAVELYPDLLDIRTDRARFHWGRGNMRLALEDLNEAKRLFPDDYWVAVDMGTLLLEMNRKEDALVEFNRAIGINPYEYRAYAYSAGLKDDLGDTDGAERDYQILSRLKPDYYFGLEGLGLHKMKNKKWLEARDAFMEAYRRAPGEDLYALLAAISWMHAEDITSPRAFLAQAHVKVKRDTLEWYMFRLFYDLTARNYLGESDVIIRLDREKDEILKARMLFYMALYYDVRGNTVLANKYFLMVDELEKKTVPEWRLNTWIITDREMKF